MTTNQLQPMLDLLQRLPPRPPESLDLVLDATERCLARYGIRRASMTDIARELKVARTTLYRQVSSLEEALALVGSRQFHRFLDALTKVVAAGGGPQAFIDAAVHGVTLARSHPVVL